jgi:hypothetical protein
MSESYMKFLAADIARTTHGFGKICNHFGWQGAHRHLTAAVSELRAIEKSLRRRQPKRAESGAAR